MNIRFEIVDDEDGGINRISNSRYDLVILDMDIVHVPAIQVLQKIKELSEAIIMVITGDMSEETGILALENGADDIQYKPLRQIEFLLKISNLVRMRLFQDRLVEEKGILKKFVSEEIADHIINEQTTNGIKTFATILFFDIRNSTALAETVSPFELAEHFNDVMNIVIDIIYKNMGSVNNILGDGILATFGYPVVYEYDSTRAIKCVQDIRNTFKTHQFKIPVQFGLGVTTGSMFSGNIGNSHKMTCTVLGDTVNTASRLQNLTKKAHVDCLIDQTTYETVKQYVKVVKYKGTVRGKAGVVNMYYPESIDVDLINLDLKAANESINKNISGIGDVEFF
jgi:class 3 adenylate cyclase